MTAGRLSRALPGRRTELAAGIAALTDRLGGRLAFGGDYNPEQWPEHVWAEDVELMRAAGVNLVSVGIFSWALLEPKEGRYEFGWLDRVLDLLHDAGIAVDLANASATPPPWFSRAYPDSLPIDVDGIRRSYGGRQAFCPSSPDYRRAAAALTEAIADRYSAHPAVAMWHVHNEYGCHNWNCFCDTSAAAFRSWLRRRYGELANLNEAWGTAFWSQRYYDWDEILPPRRPAYNTFANPTQQLDFARFGSDELLGCFRAEADILRAHSRAPVTTNFMSFFKPMDYWAWAQAMDLIANDHYRVATLGTGDAAGSFGATHDLAMSADLMRSLADTAPWLLMEHSSSAVNWQPRNPAKPAGQMRRDSLTHIARGADGALFFQWRASQAGAEKFHSALLPHAGTDSARWREVVALGADLSRLGPVTGTRTVAEVAIAFDWNAWWAVELDSHPSIDMDQMTRVRQWHRVLWELGITCDFVHPDRDLSAYRAVLVPAIYLCDDAVAANLHAVLDRGGAVVVGSFSGIVDVDDHIRLGGYPGAFQDLLGVRVEEFAPLMPGEQIDVVFDSDLVGSGHALGSVWSELITETAPDAEVLARFGGSDLSGLPALTRRATAAGSGGAWYLATDLPDSALQALLARACGEAGCTPVIAIEGERPVGLELTVREGNGERFLFAVNHSDRNVALPVTGTDLLTDRGWSPGQLLPAGDVAVVRLVL